jgi:hypothetical protein
VVITRQCGSAQNAWVTFGEHQWVSSGERRRSKKFGAVKCARLNQKDKVPFKRSRWLLLKNPWNLSDAGAVEHADCTRLLPQTHLLQLATPGVRNLLIPNKAIPASVKS